ncbi:MAG: F0F1 ATP synthase subunit delta [Pseudorhodobacter sp.]|nr:F0F1 ATP synthase subunit delta [Pseudorhodobacter sp.]
MTIDWWGLGLQAINVLILVWLLTRVFWHPIAGAIAARKDAALAMLDAAQATQTKADEALAEVTKAREGIASEREAILAIAATTADAAIVAALQDAHEKAERITAAARLTIERDTEASIRARAAQTSQLAVEIAAKLLARLDTPSVHSAFLTLLLEAIREMPPNDRAALIRTTTGIDLFSATDLDDAEKEKITQALGQMLGATPDLTFVTDPDLIAGFEMRTAHFVLHNSWKSDLARILKGVKNAA